MIYNRRVHFHESFSMDQLTTRSVCDMSHCFLRQTCRWIIYREYYFYNVLFFIMRHSMSLININLTKIVIIFLENKLPCAHWQIGWRALRDTLSIACSNCSGDYVARYNFKADVIVTVSAWTVIAAFRAFMQVNNHIADIFVCTSLT